MRYRFRTAWTEEVRPKALYATRVGFGVALIVSVAAVFATLAAISAGAGTTTAGGDNDRRDGRGGGMGRPMMSEGMRGSGYYRGGGISGRSMGGGFLSPLRLFGPSPLDLFLYRPRYGLYGKRSGRQREGRDRKVRGESRRSTGGESRLTRRSSFFDSDEGDEDDNHDEAPDLSFLESIFSHVFGDGDPNSGLEGERLAAAVALIRLSGGAVTAEQLAPYLTEVPSPLEGEGVGGGVVPYTDESYVLPLVVRLGGEPRVTGEGDIVYVFPDLMITALISDGDDDSYPLVPRRSVRVEDLQESELIFSAAGSGQRAAAIALGAINLLGALVLRGAIKSRPELRLPGLYGMVQRGHPVLLAYAVLYNVIPVVRYAALRLTNAKIRERNSRRRGWVRRAKEAGARKIRRAREFGREMRRVQDEGVAYDTEEDISALKQRLARDELSDFDNLML